MVGGTGPTACRVRLLPLGGGGLEPFEWDDLGIVDGLDIVHPQCHIGTDTISLARRGARTTGLDFSAQAIAGARRLAQEAGMADRTAWVVADAYDAVAAVGRSFDLVYTGKGALCWLPDMDRWAAVMWGLCRPGGRLYVSEFHPLADVLGDDDTDIARSYFPQGGEVFDDGAGSYAAPGAETVHNTIVDFIHPLSEVIGALLGVGFRLRAFRELPFTVFARWPWLAEREPGVWSMPGERPDLPLMYSMLWERPA
ncbi:MAG: class I SAM-dependent methyltransferase [Acidimicrobiales bacterium]